MPERVHLIVGGYPPGSAAGHDMDYARLRLLELLREHDDIVTTVASDFNNIESGLQGTSLLLTYVAGPYPDEASVSVIDTWLEDGGRWFGLHGTSGGKAARMLDRRGRTMVKLAHHHTLGSFFLNHPPLRRFGVAVTNQNHPLTHDLPDQFDVDDELYLIEVLGSAEILLTTDMPQDPSPPGFGFHYERDTSIQADGRTRVLGYEKSVGNGKVAYVALGHCHSPITNSQPFVDDSIAAGGHTPATFRGPWETAEFAQLLSNAINWGVARSAA
ncbi:MAG: ThuA domain-containing protein [Pseudomonadales bacterium]|jgi:hypothetical protein|nr:ThuA domain-containing protein [Pseudomonadales bacterium]MDP6469909.1 ThuA domain-containing protein [Pseudomonadales bacterium]MDP6827488.1 ThuA domain-containing protein [Pseudomonadales bacterium]MDP6970772.1 ThuA domain-containing protein [Pseudomonadales bacterium]|tara:strand:- start:1453 stop:2268 length:816 start_codon:yes stop_codon:yes gene_type:complete